jgi:hypothetical protein
LKHHAIRVPLAAGAKARVAATGKLRVRAARQEYAVYENEYPESTTQRELQLKVESMFHSANSAAIQ